ncbi:MAG: hypothetical protein NZ578_07105 [Candidatus Binatia bacterium]|nr:hypothetical protein [Candidatus Binatia bacterium]
MDEKTIEWNLGFPVEEVLAGLDKLLAGTVSVREEREGTVWFHLPLASGVLTLTVQPLHPSGGPFQLQTRTLLRMTFSGVAPQAEAQFVRRLTLAFLRVGG